MTVAVNPAFPEPFNESFRLEVLRNLDLKDRGDDPVLDALVARACARFDVPTGFVSLLEADRQWFQARCGLDMKGTDRSEAFCAHTIVDNEPLVVSDALEDTRFADNPLVTGPPYLRFYAGAPVVVDGAAIGTLCVSDSRPRPDMDPDDIAYLTGLAGTVAHYLVTVTGNAPHRNSEGLTREGVAHNHQAHHNLLALFGHELKTPLNAILGFSDLLAGAGDGHSPQERREFAGYISDAGARLFSVIDRILTMSNLESGDMRLHYGRVMLDDLVAEVEALSGRHLRERNVRMNSEVPGKVALDGDETHLAQALAELVSNAIAASEAGADVALRAERHYDNSLILKVDDAGPGMEPGVIRQLATGSVALSGDIRAKRSGLGVGLPITRAIARLHGGTLDLVNRTHQGKRHGLSARLVLPPHMVAWPDGQSAP
ncbi:GAF domain-containing sensor histidine kinase [Yunchengibacter salinarum]|uniref:GAF domain-containing sensor histidine kinase n=1 Tax=Yunchengibacter salinarum TaxID=3133399 RepID=UPI0035B69542